MCVIALLAFLLLSIFSARYRPLARRALHCVARKALLRPCDTGLDEQIKAGTVAGILKVSPRAARLVFRHFEAFSVTVTLLFVVSTIWVMRAGYYLWVCGNCNGPDGGPCFFLL
jgi:hypothetical protein